MAKAKGSVAAQFDWTYVKQVPDAYGSGQDVYDIWQWNLFKLKWARLSNTACGYDALEDARRDAGRMSTEIQDMLDANRDPPPRPR